MSWMCIVLFSDDPPVNSAELARHYQASWPGSPPLGPPDTKDNVVSFNVGGDWVLIGRMPAAIPDMQIDDQFAELMWPGARRDVERHRFHWIVTVGGNQGKEADKARLLTRFIHALLASHPSALGVTWGSHAHLVSSKVFQEGAISLRANEDPTHLWITVRCGWRPEGAAAGKSAGMTRGLADFELMEIEAVEAQESPTDLYDRLQGLAGYLVKRGLVIRDGDTVGADEDEKIKVVYSDSAFGAEGRVMRLVYGEAGSVGGKPPGPSFSTPAAPLAAAPVVATPVAASPFNASPAVGNLQAPNPFAATTSPTALPPNNTSWRPPGPGGPAPPSPPGAWTPPPAPNASGSWGASGAAPAYGAPAYGTPGVAGYPRPSTAPTSTSVLAIFSLICGIVAPFLLCLCFLSLPTSILAVVMGHIALSHIKHSGGKLTGRGAAIAGVILGYITLLLSIAFLLWIFVIAPNRNSSTFSTFPGANEIELDPDDSSGSGPVPPTFPKIEIPQPQFPKPELPKRVLPESLDPAVPPSAPPPTSPPTSTPPASTPPANAPPKNDLPGAPPFGAPTFPPIPMPRGPLFPEGIPGGPPGFPPGFPPLPGATPGSTPGSMPTPGRTPSVPDPFAPAESTGRTMPRRERGGREAVDPSVIEASLSTMTWPVKSLAFSADGSRLAVGRLDSTMLVFDLKTNEQMWKQDHINALGQAVVAAFSPDGKTLIAGGYSGKLLVWNLDEKDSPPKELTSHTQPITCFDMQREGKFIITGSQDGKVIWQPPTQPDKSRTLAVHKSPVRAVRVGSPATTAWVTDGKEATQIDLRKSEVLRTVRLGGGAVLAAALSHDARFVAVSEGGKVKVWELETGKEVAVLDGRSEIQWSLQFSPDGKSLLSGSRGKLLKWDFMKGEQTKTLSLGGIQHVQTFAISADSQRAAAILDSAGQTLYVLKLAD